MSAIELTYLERPGHRALAPSDESILDAVEDGLRAQGHGETVIEPRVHLRADPSVDGHFNVLRGSLPAIGLAGVKIVGDFVENYRLGPAVGDGAAQPLRPVDRDAAGDPRRDGDHRRCGPAR